jgi:hypothetical protein
LAGIEKDAPKPGRNPQITQQTVEEIITLTAQSQAEGATHWSSRPMAQAMSVSESSVARIWKAHGLKPHLMKTFKLWNDKQFVEKLEYLVRLYLSPPENAFFFSCDEKSQMQATRGVLQFMRWLHAACNQSISSCRPIALTQSSRSMQSNVVNFTLPFARAAISRSRVTSTRCSSTALWINSRSDVPPGSISTSCPAIRSHCPRRFSIASQRNFIRLSGCLAYAAHTKGRVAGQWLAARSWGTVEIDPQ